MKLLACSLMVGFGLAGSFVYAAEPANGKITPIAEPASANPAMESKVPGSSLTLGAIDATSDDFKTVVTIRFDKKIGWEIPAFEDHGSFVQLIMPKTQVPKSGEFLEGNSPYIRKIAAFQVTNEDGGLRLFVSRDTPAIIKATTIEKLSDRIVMEIDHKLVEQNMSAAGASVAEVIEKTEVRHDVADPVATVQQNLKVKGEEPKSTETMGIDFKNKFTTVGIFSAVFIVGLLLLAFSKSLVKKKIKMRESDPYSIKTLANHVLSPKQKITLIQVAGEKILLGVTPDNISFLTNIDSRPRGLASDGLLEGSIRGPLAIRAETSPLLTSRSGSASAALEKIKSLRKGAVKPSFDEEIDNHEHDELNPLSRPVPANEPKKLKREISRTKAEPKGSSVSYAVGDNGIKDLRNSRTTKSSGVDSSEDVTSMIRKKLKNLPQI